MNQPLSRKYRGIAVFGCPCSGKTTLARALRRRLPGGIRLIEASRDILGPSASLRDLPGNQDALLRKLKEGGLPVARLSRDEARDFFVSLNERYHSSVIAEIADCLTGGTEEPALLTGLRGEDNAVRLEKLGYLIVYLRTPRSVAASRLVRRDGRSRRDAAREILEEERLYRTGRIERVAQLIIDTSRRTPQEAVADVIAAATDRECRRCPNSTANPTVTVGADGLCNVCAAYAAKFNRSALRRELETFRAFIGSGNGKYDLLVGLSGGKDSTTMLQTVLEMGFTPLAFTLDSGYYPRHIFSRAARVAKQLGVDHVRIPIANYARPVDLRCFKKTADLYDRPDTPENSREFLEAYQRGRSHYSVKCGHALPFVRSCQLCRRLVVRAYFAEALKYGVKAVALGINEWAGLSRTATATGHESFSALRVLRPRAAVPSVTVCHVPFLLQRRKADTVRILKKMGWQVPTGEAIIESNANSCLFARAAEAKATRLLGFHPDTTRLAREVTVGFISKRQAMKALMKKHPSRQSVRDVLAKAGYV